jgi:membrane associated rhomboid family serine protease
MFEHSLVTLLIIAVTVFVSYKGFSNRLFMESYCFDVDRVLVNKDYIRLVSSGFLHNSWMHLLFNMIALYAFGSMLEPSIGGTKLLIVYFLSLIGGDLLALYIYKASSGYRSVGASGAVNGVIYAGIALFPQMKVGFFFLPLSIPAWVFGIVYVIFTIYGIKAKWGASGHAAHLGGALIGMLIAVAFYPEVLGVNYLPILLILLPTVAFIMLIIYKPEVLLIDSFSKKKQHYSIDHKYNYQKAKEQADIDYILEKIHRKGMKSLTKPEKEALERYARMKR